MSIVDLDKLSEMFWDGNYMEIHKDDIPSIPSAFEGMTNGEVIQALFPIEGIWKDVDFVEVIFKGETHTTYFTRDFWDSPYKKGGEDI